MSGGVTAAAWAAAGVAAVGTAVSYQNGKEQASQQASAQRQAQANADKQAAQADQDFNRANQKKPDTVGMLSAAQQAGKGGASGTMLTGPSGVDPNSLTLGKSTLLGM
ncbi:MAG: hypothetical protein LBV14_13360 [Acidovorax sp.]|jgi:Flp pilus assembly protein TadB|nr:hypothetical protein [Acidovorax sp.]